MMEKLDTVTNAENDRKSFELENLLLKLKVSIAEEKRMKALIVRTNFSRRIFFGGAYTRV